MRYAIGFIGCFMERVEVEIDKKSLILHFMRKIYVLILLLFSTLFVMAQGYVTNVRALQEGQKIVLLYDLTKDTYIRQVNMRVGGTQRCIPMYSLKGDVDKLISAGKNKRIEYDVLLDYTDGFRAENVVFEIQSILSDYVDLGLPSGTLWKNANEGGNYAHYTYDEAVSEFGNKLPTKQQLQELKKECTWTWTGRGYKVTGPNGNSIFLPAAGYSDCDVGVRSVGTYGYYLSFTPRGSDLAWSLYFDSSEVDMDYGNCCDGLSVRLVQN